jgi:hypothetical protein
MTRFDFVFAADDGIHLAFAGDFGQVAAKRFERGSFDFAFLLGLRCFLTGLGGGLFFLRGKIGIEFLQDFLAGLFDVHVEIFQDAGGDAVAFAEQAEQNVFGADVGMIEGFGFLGSEREDFLDAGCVRDVADHLLIGPVPTCFSTSMRTVSRSRPSFWRHVDGDPLAELDKAEEEVFGADKIVIETVGFLAREGEHLLRPRREIVHGFVAHIR